MSAHITPVSPPLRVNALQVGGQAQAARLLAIRWSEESQETDALVLTEHGGIEWIPHDRVEAGRIE
jgi:hypothetical protein